MKARNDRERTAHYASTFAALGAEPRLSIIRLLLAAHPQGLVAGDIQGKLRVPASTLSHHLDKLKNQGLLLARRAGTFVWYTANTQALGELLTFLYAECCRRGQAPTGGDRIQIERPSRRALERKR